MSLLLLLLLLLLLVCILVNVCCVQLYSRGHIKLLGAELSELDVFARMLKVNDKRFVCTVFEVIILLCSVLNLPYTAEK